MFKKENLIEAIQNGEEFDFYGFLRGPFSNWYYSPFEIEGEKYCCMEQYLMAEKARLFADRTALRWIMLSSSPKEIKNWGRKVRNFSVEVWNIEKEDIALRGCYAKFSQNEALKNHLLNEDSILVECNPNDLIWGAGIGMADVRLSEPEEWPGENLLGFVLMEVRRKILEKENENV